MSVLRGLICALSSFTRIPVPSFNYKDGDMRFMMAMFPLVGVVVGGIVFLWIWLCELAGIGQLLMAIGVVVLPIAITGGIHLDGYCDVNDALASHAPMEKKIAILKDPHIGAFAAIWLGVYLLLSVGVLCETYLYSWMGSYEVAGILALGFILSRCSASFASLLLPKSASKGMLAAQTESADKRTSCVIVSLIAVLCIAGMAILDWRRAIFVVAFVALAFGYVALISRKQFGGMSGDVAGYHLQITEFMIFLALMAAGKVLI